MPSPLDTNNFGRVESSKRKASEISAPVKRRAPRACVVCRNRKVRCDVVQSGLPCTNCRLDNATCVLSESNRGRHSSIIVDNSRNVDIECDASYSPEAQSDPTKRIPVSLTFEAPDRMSEDWDPSTEDRNSLNTPDVGNMHIYRNGSSSTPGSLDHQSHRLPRYIQPLPSHIGIDDLEYLAKKDALTIPSDELRGRLLQHYIQYVHPFVPILDLEDFLTRIAQPDQSKPISLLLFQAVMFVSVTFVAIEHLHAAGFKNRKSARKIYFQRARLLYGLDCEIDRISLLQALLLMTYWYENPQDVKDTWHWMGIGLSLAQVLGFHRDPENLSHATPGMKRMHKRLWWSCFMRDRLLALGIRRPTRIRNEDFSVPMLTLDDFEMAPIPQELLKSLCKEPLLAQDPDSCRAVAIACIEMAKLCVCIGNVLSSQYSILGDKSSAKAEFGPRTMVVPRYSSENIQDIVRCDMELTEWIQNLTPGCRYSSMSMRAAKEISDTQRMIRFNTAQLAMTYMTAVTVLHRPRSLQSPGDDGPSHKLSRSKVTEAAIDISEIAYDLHHQSQLRYLPTSSIPAILWATLTHLTDISSAKDDTRFSSIGRFYQCMQALEELRDMYAAADHAVWFLETVIKKNDVHIPGFSIGMAPHRHSTSKSPGSSSSADTQNTRFAQSSSGSMFINTDHSMADRTNMNTVSPNFGMGNGLIQTFTNGSPGTGSGVDKLASVDRMSSRTIDFDGMNIDDMMGFDVNSDQYSMTNTGNSYSVHDLGGLVGYMLNSPIQGFHNE